MSFFKRNFSDFSNFCVDTLFLNEHAQLIKWSKLKKALVKTLLNDLAQLKNKFKKNLCEVLVKWKCTA